MSACPDASVRAFRRRAAVGSGIIAEIEAESAAHIVDAGIPCGPS
jgi:hypothetical protein